MDIVKRIPKMKQLSRDAHAAGQRVALVPTMGYLHEGHLSLVARARELADLVVVSIFVNPTQFGPNEDFDSYPRDSHRDTELAKKAGVDLLFMPQADELYPPGFASHVEVEQLSERLCGARRPGHFRGVTTIVLKLFNIVQPHFAVFGLKDAQQAIVIKRMAEDLNLDVELVFAETVRESDGLALSSRNVRLEPEQRLSAAVIPRALETVKARWRDGERSAARLLEELQTVLAEQPAVELEYAELVDLDSLLPLERVESSGLLALAAHVGGVRLIDNLILDTASQGE